MENKNVRPPERTARYTPSPAHRKIPNAALFPPITCESGTQPRSPSKAPVLATEPDFAPSRIRLIDANHCLRHILSQWRSPFIHWFIAHKPAAKLPLPSFRISVLSAACAASIRKKHCHLSFVTSFLKKKSSTTPFGQSFFFHSASFSSRKRHIPFFSALKNNKY